MPPPDELCLVTYNCRGWSSGQTALRDLLKSLDICLIQEHWLLHDQLRLLNIDAEFLSVAVSGMDSSSLLPGRPFGGCGTVDPRLSERRLSDPRLSEFYSWRM